MEHASLEALPAAAVAALRARLAGDFVLPGDPGWDEARQAWNLAVDQRPAAVAVPESAADVAPVVDFARRHGLRVAAQGTGHNAGALGDLDETILVKTHRLRGVEIDAAAWRARVEAGALWMDVTEPAAEHGLAALAGSSPDVGVVGYALGGGVSWLARRYGLAANSVLAIEVVTADGRLVRADRDKHPDLFWALRGGGGSFGVVTAIELALFPIREVYAGVLFFPIERASEVLNAWREWVEDVPDELTSIGRLLRFPPIPDIPEPLRGRAFVAVEATYLGDEADAAELLRPLRALGPELDTFATIPVKELSKLHMDPEGPVPGHGDGATLDELTAETIEALLTAAGPDVDSPLVSVEVRHLGGALARPSNKHGALSSLDARFLMFAVGITMTPDLGAAVHAHVEAVKDALEPWTARHMYLNFAETSRRASSFYTDEAYRRLRRIKTQYDAGDLFRSNHPIPPLERARRQHASRAFRRAAAARQRAVG